MAYTLIDLQIAVQDDLNDANFSSTRITRYLNAAQRKIFNTHMFRFCEKSIQGALTLSAYTYLQQSDHQSTIRGLIWDSTNTTRRLILDEDSYMGHRQFFEQFEAPELNTSGFPSYWTEFGKQVYFDRPVDSANYQFKQRYFRVPTSLVNSSDIPDVPEAFRELLEQYACYKSEKYRGNHDIAATYKQDFDDGLEEMVLRYGEATQIGPVVIPSIRQRIEGS